MRAQPKPWGDCSFILEKQSSFLRKCEKSLQDGPFWLLIAAVHFPVPVPEHSTGTLAVSTHCPTSVSQVWLLLPQENVRALTRGVQAVMSHRLGGVLGPSTPSHHGGPGKPWKKHGNRNKKEKIRRVTRHLDA